MQRLITRKGTFNLFYLALVLFPLVWLIFLIWRYHVDVLFWDEWNFVPFVDEFNQGTLSLRDLWSQIGEHRILFPRIVMLLLTRFSSWDTSYELGFSILLAIAILAVLVRQTQITGQLLQVQLKWLIPVLSIMVFSLSQAQNWLWGWQLSEFMNVLAVLAGIVLLQTPDHWARYSAAILLGVVASYSFGNGLLYWFIGLLVLLVLTFGNWRLMISRGAIWVAAAGLTFLSYFYDYHALIPISVTLSTFYKPLDFTTYVLTFLGAPVLPTSFECTAHGYQCDQAIFAASVASLSGLILFGYVTWSLWNRGKFKTLVPFLGMALYAILSGSEAGFERMDFGLQQGMQSRYLTFSSLFWIALSASLFVWAKTTETRDKRRRRAGYSLVILVAGLVTLNSIQWSGGFPEHYAHYSPLRTVELSPQNDQLLALFPWAPSLDWMMTQRQVLIKYHLSVFREP